MSQPNQLSADSRAAPVVNYLNADRRRLVVAHRRSITSASASCTWSRCCSLFLLGGIFAMALRHRAAHARARPHRREHLQPDVHAARRGHGLPVHDPGHPGRVRQLLLPLMLGAKDVAFPRLNLLSLYLYWTGAVLALVRHDHGRHRHGLDLLRALQHAHADDGVPGAAGRLHPRLLVDHHRPQLHRHRPHAARARASPGCGCRSSCGPSTRPASSRCSRRRSSA